MTTIQPDDDRLYHDALNRVLAARKNEIQNTERNQLGPVTFGPVVLTERKAEGVNHVHGYFTVRKKIFV